jgi:hypothetical protein
MHCKIGWNHAFMRATFPSSWLNKEYKQIRRKLLFDQEVAKIPDTQRFCEAAREKADALRHRGLLNDELTLLRTALSENKSAYEDCTQDIWIIKDDEKSNDELVNLKSRAHELYQTIKTLEEKIDGTTESIQGYTDKIHRLTAFIEGNEPCDKQSSFQLACPVNQCKGFVESDWKCGLCSSKICSECHEKKEDRDMFHTCNPETKASVEMLQNDSKPCPNCGALIHKISGCDQMWCTQCRTAFSWNTGNLEEVVHNPHYFEWLRKKNANANAVDMERPGDQPCNRFVSENSTFGIVHTIRKVIPDEIHRDLIMNLVRLLLHISQVELPNCVPSYVRQIPHDPHRELRIKYMLNEIDLDEFQSILVKREKERMKKEEINQILQTFVEVMDDLLRKLLSGDDDGNDRMELKVFLETVEDLRCYINGSLGDVAQLFSCKRKEILQNFSDIVVAQ